ncbi:MAG: hypothetical protein NC254_01075 [bacterium]|nr:hypothetical protein [bacterium]
MGHRMPEAGRQKRTGNVRDETEKASGREERRAKQGKRADRKNAERNRESKRTGRTQSETEKASGREAHEVKQEKQADGKRPKGERRVPGRNA